MNALAAWLRDAAFTAPYWTIGLATLGWFVLIYGVIAGGAWLLIGGSRGDARSPDGRQQRMRPKQVREELMLSLLSIAIFACEAVALVWALRNDLLTINWARSPWHLAWELPVLYLWNELHFFAIHRALHWPPLYRSVHVKHHRSVITTPFSAYSFHPVESFLLGSVMLLALAIHAFSPLALLGLTIMSLLLNVAGHLPQERVHPLLAFVVPQTVYHNRHHREFHSHFAFSLGLLDRWLGHAATRSRKEHRA